MYTQKMVKKVLRKVLGLSKSNKVKQNKSLIKFNRKTKIHHSGIPQDVADFAKEYAKRNSVYYRG